MPPRGAQARGGNVSGCAVPRTYPTIPRLLFRLRRNLSVVRADALNSGRCEYVQRTIGGEGDFGDAAADALGESARVA